MKKNLLFGILMFAVTTVAAQPSIDNAFFDKVNFRGAFGTHDWTAGWANFNPQATVYPVTTATITAGNITTNTTWTKDKVYLLNGWVYVKDGATLTIEAGTVIRGDKASKAALIVEKGGKLIANGTATEPIVFTSNQAANSRTYGDWGGVILCGKAPINLPNNSGTIEGGVGSTYGGTDPNDNSGSLQYIRIEFSGVEFVTNSEINGLTMGGVGAGTTLSHIQVSYCGDDSYEWFGGTVNAKYLIAFRGWDDDFDTDNGYSGMVQYAVSLRDPDVADQSQSNGFESDNDKDGNAVSPYTSVIFSNVSLYGPKVTPSTTVNSLYRRAAHIRRNNKMQIYNAVFAGWPTGLYIDGATTQANAIANDLKVRNSVIAGMTTSIDVPVSQTWDKAAAEAWYNTVSFKNAVLTANSDLGVTDAFNLTAPKFNLTAGSVLNTGSYWNVPTSIFSPKSASANSLKVYPNPATSQVIVELPEFNGFTTIQVTDLAGRNLINKTVSNVEKEILNISELRKGMYMIVARQGNTTYNQKLTVR